MASPYIADVVDMGVPSITMRVYYDSKLVTSGCTIKPSIATEPPRITMTGYPHDLFTLVMTDPDAPSPNEPSMREWVHWIVTDIPGGTNPTEGKEILPYVAPCPAAGIHRYILILYKQKGPLGLVDPPLNREKFCSRDFASEQDLVSPVATMYFNAQREPIKRKR